MSKRNGPRYALLGLFLIALLAALAFTVKRAPDAAEPAAQATQSDDTQLQSLAELNGKEPARRKLDIQSWKTAEGAKVLFVEARELPMFDLRLTYAGGSSQDGDVPGLRKASW